MAKFRVHAKSQESFYIDVEAKDKNEAYEKAKYAHGGDFTRGDYGDWLTEKDTIEKLERGKFEVTWSIKRKKIIEAKDLPEAMELIREVDASKEGEFVEGSFELVKTKPLTKTIT